MNIILIGFKNSGKTTFGKQLAEALQINFIDTDQLIEKYYFDIFGHSLSIPEIYQQQGEAVFRSIESKIIRGLKDENKVIATGGGMVLNRHNINHLKQIGKLVYLETDYEILYLRTLKRKPIFLQKTDLAESFAVHHHARKTFYEAVQDLTINLQQEPLETVFAKIKKLQNKQEG